MCFAVFFFFKQKTAYEMRISDWSSDVCSSDLFYGVTLKDVAKRVGVHHTLVNYYFDDKKTLFDAVFARRAIVTIEKRMKALDDYDRAAGGNPTVEGALHAFLDTDLDLYIQGGEGWKNYGARSDEHTTELQPLMSNSYAVFCLKKK